MKVLLENLLRNENGGDTTEADLKAVAAGSTTRAASSTRSASARPAC